MIDGGSRAVRKATIAEIGRIQDHNPDLWRRITQAQMAFRIQRQALEKASVG